MSSLRSGGSLGHYITAAVADNMNITNTHSLSLHVQSTVTAIGQHMVMTVSLSFAFLLGLLLKNTTTFNIQTAERI